MIPYSWLEAAIVRLDPHVIETPFTYDSKLDIYLKWENHQVTGSFKARGAINKVLSLQTWECQKGLVAASAGNHGQGVALAGKLIQVPVIIFASEHAAPTKIQSMRALGADVRLVAGGYGEAEQAGLAFASQTGLQWISPYNDGQVIAGQGTLALETLRQFELYRQRQSKNSIGPLHWVVPVGGGGLCAGIACALFSNPQPVDTENQLIAVQSEASPFFYEIYHQGTQSQAIELPSLADGLAGPVEDGSVTIPILRRYVNQFLLVKEEEIEKAIVYAWTNYNEVIEGSAAASLAAVLFGEISLRPAVVIISGGNINPELHRKIIERYA